jgi:hypothetical protein
MGYLLGPMPFLFYGYCAMRKSKLSNSAVWRIKGQSVTFPVMAPYVLSISERDGGFVPANLSIPSFPAPFVLAVHRQLASCLESQQDVPGADVIPTNQLAPIAAHLNDKHRNSKHCQSVCAELSIIIIAAALPLAVGLCPRHVIGC